jgi:NADH-quinone oxidoreductase subunit C
MATPDKDVAAPEIPVADPAEAAAAAASPVHDPRRPRLLPGTEGDPLTLEQLAERIVNGFGAVTTDVKHGELNVHVAPERVHALLEFLRDDTETSCGFLSDLAGVHWPAGDDVIERQPATTGWPDYRVTRDSGVIEVNYILRSTTRNMVLRVVVGLDDADPVVDSVTDLFPTANYHEREVHDMFGVVFTGHPNLARILMPDEWVGHPHRKDYPLGGVEVEYVGDKFIPSPAERDLRRVVGGDEQ